MHCAVHFSLVHNENCLDNAVALMTFGRCAMRIDDFGAMFTLEMFE